MAYNGSGTFNRLYSWVADALAGTKISSSRMDAEMDGFATGLTTAITKDGQTTATAALPMGNFNHTGVGAATARTHYTRASQTQDSSIVYASAGGTADVITLALAPAITAYAAGQKFHFIASGTNAGAVTLNVNGVGATAVKKTGGVALAAGDIISAQACIVVHDGTDFELVNPTMVTRDTAQTISALKTFTAGADMTPATTPSTTAVGYLGSPVVDGNSAYAIVMTDAGKTIYHNEAGARTWTIPANASVAFPIGTVIILDNTGNAGAAGTITLAITSDTLRRGDGTAGTGSRTIAASQVAAIRKVAATEWIITGTFS